MGPLVCTINMSITWPQGHGHGVSSRTYTTKSGVAIFVASVPIYVPDYAVDRYAASISRVTRFRCRKCYDPNAYTRGKWYRESSHTLHSFHVVLSEWVSLSAAKRMHTTSPSTMEGNVQIRGVRQ